MEGGGDGGQSSQVAASPHGKLLKYKSLTDPLLVQLLEQTDQVSVAGAGNSALAGGIGSSSGRFKKGKWSSQFTSLTDMAGWMSASPWYKWKMKGRSPMKLFLHISIAILSLFQIVFLSTNTGKVIRNTKTLMDDIINPMSSPVFNLTGLIGATNHTMCGLCSYKEDSLMLFDLKEALARRRHAQPAGTTRSGLQISTTKLKNFNFERGSLLSWEWASV